MIRLSQFITILSLIFLISIGFVFFQKPATNEKLNSRVQLKTDSLEEILQLYWNASLRGDQTVVGQLSTLPPKDMFQDCLGNKRVENIEDNKYFPDELKEIDNTDNDSKEKVETSFTDKDIPDDVGTTSRYIFQSKVFFDRVKITKETIYQDEAILELIIADEKGDLKKTGINEKIFFFKRENQIWKIIRVGNKDILLSISEKINYAIPRPLCE